MAKLTKDQIKVKLESLSSNQQIVQPSEEALDEAFLQLVYDAQKQTCEEMDEDYDNECSYKIGVDDGQILYARWVLESLFGINMATLKELLT